MPVYGRVLAGYTQVSIIPHLLAISPEQEESQLEKLWVLMYFYHEHSIIIMYVHVPYPKSLFKISKQEA